MFLKAICLGNIQGSKWPTETYPILSTHKHLILTGRMVFPWHSPFPDRVYTPSYKELVKTVNNVFEGHMLRKNPRKQMTNRDVPHFIHTQTLRFQHVTDFPPPPCSRRRYYVVFLTTSKLVSWQSSFEYLTKVYVWGCVPPTSAAKCWWDARLPSHYILQWGRSWCW